MTTAPADWSALLEALPGIGLEELDAEAALQTRVDRKYIVEPATWAAVMADLEGARALDMDGVRAFRYASTYYDTPELHSYTSAARRRLRLTPFPGQVLGWSSGQRELAAFVL